MSSRLLRAALSVLLCTSAAVVHAGDDDVIRLGPGNERVDDGSQPVEVGEARRGFDYVAFVARVESLWFQRKTLLASGREEDAQAQLEQIRSFCAEEGVKRLEHLAGALVAEAHRFQREGNDRQALSALDFAEAFDPGRPQIHTARAAVLWQVGRIAPAMREMVRALGASGARSFQDLSFLPRVAFVIGMAWLATFAIFAVVMTLRYQAPVRHEIEEWGKGFLCTPWPEVAGWALLGLPLMIWPGAAWAGLFWLVVCFRFMTRTEKLATACLLSIGALTLPTYGIAVGLYGTSADPAVRTTVTSVEGEYDPDRVVRLRRLVEAHPDDPAYHFLLAGLYKNGRYFEEAFDQYKKVLELDASFSEAQINIGNIFYSTGQYAAAITSYHEVVADEPDSFLAHFNLHLAQSEDFHFTEAEESLLRAREIDPDRVARLLGRSSGFEDRAAVQDATLRMVSVWEAAIGGRSPTAAEHAAIGGAPVERGSWLNSVAILCLLSLGAAVVLSLVGRTPARRCIRCGRPFCHRCKRNTDAKEYCTQCLHLFVLRDGLEPETKARKLYEVRAHERRTRNLRRLFALFLPGTSQLFHGKPARGLLLLLVWFALLICAAPELVSLGPGAQLHASTDLLLVSEVPVRFDPHPGRYLAALLLPLLWLVGNWPTRKAREA